MRWRFLARLVLVTLAVLAGVAMAARAAEQTPRISTGEVLVQGPREDRAATADVLGGAALVRADRSG